MSVLHHEKTARTTVGQYTFVKKGISRFDLRDPYHVAVTLSRPQFLTALLGLYLAVNVVFAALYAAVPGSITFARPGNFLRRRSSSASRRWRPSATARCTRMGSTGTWCPRRRSSADWRLPPS
ncbi:MAG: hypothetical protein WDN04_00290 [Rhodospirillales bacterium]